MNTILITGMAHTENNQPDVFYKVNIWASKEGEQIQFIQSLDLRLSGYSELWHQAKYIASSYFGGNNKFDDGAYTQFLDHINLV